MAKEQGKPAKDGHDPIHDQNVYLDKELRECLRFEKKVDGYTILLSFLRDSVYIPAGAPHQVIHAWFKRMY